MLVCSVGVSVYENFCVSMNIFDFYKKINNRKKFLDKKKTLRFLRNILQQISEIKRLRSLHANCIVN